MFFLIFFPFCLKVFSYLSGAELCSVCRVNREWNEVASHNSLWARACFDAVSWENLMEIDMSFKLLRRCQLRVFRDDEQRDGTKSFLLLQEAKEYDSFSFSLFSELVLF